MRKIIILFISVLLTVFSLSLFSGGPEYQIDLNSSYIWRGFDLNPSHKPVIQPSVTFYLEECGFGVNIWSSFSFEDKNTNEVDFTIYYDFKSIKNLSLSVGIVHFSWYFTDNFDFKKDTTQEVYLSVGFPNVPLTPGVSVFYDINNGDGLYVQASLGHSIKINDNYGLDLSASIGYNGGQWIDDSGFSDINFSAALPLKFGRISLTPSANFTHVLLDSVSLKDHFWVGASIAF